MAHKIVYQRGTTFNITHIYKKNGVNSSEGAKLYFTVKTSQYDADTADTTALVQIPVVMSGSTNAIIITPTAIAPTVPSGDYFYDIKVIEALGAEYIVDQGTFTLQASPTNKVS